MSNFTLTATQHSKLHQWDAFTVEVDGQTIGYVEQINRFGEWTAFYMDGTLCKDPGFTIHIHHDAQMAAQDLVGHIERHA